MDNENFRLNNIENKLKELENSNKELSKAIIIIEKSNIRQEGSLIAILDTYKIIKNTVIGFFVLNLLAMLAAFWLK